MNRALFILLFIAAPLFGQDVNQDGIPVLVRPASIGQPEAPKPEPPKPKAAPKPKESGDPLAKERKRLQEWEASLSMTADSLAERLRAIAERERLLAEKERAMEARKAALEARKSAIASREEAMKLASEPAAAPPAPLEMVNRKLAVSSVKVNRWSGPKAPSIVGAHAMVIDAANGRILHEKAARQAIPAAELLQLMTALLVCEAGELDKAVKIEESDASVDGEKAGLQAGQTYKRAELLSWLLAAGGNDVATALARDNAGTVDAFVAKMNARGKQLGLLNTTFKNPSGRDTAGQASTARDLALLAWECYHQSFVREAVKVKSFKLSIGGQTRYATNANQLLGQMVACNGMKHGKSQLARTALVTSAEKSGRQRIIVVLKSTDHWVFKDSKVLIEWSLRSD